MEDLLDGTAAVDPKYPSGAVAAAYVAMNNKHFYNATLVNFITPWTNEARAIFPEDIDTEGTLNDYTATVIGVIRDEIDFRRILESRSKTADGIGLADLSRAPDQQGFTPGIGPPGIQVVIYQPLHLSLPHGSKSGTLSP